MDGVFGCFTYIYSEHQNGRASANFLLLGLFTLFLSLIFHGFDLSGISLVFLGLCVKVIEVKGLHHVLFFEHELLNLPGNDGGHPTYFLALLEQLWGV